MRAWRNTARLEQDLRDLSRALPLLIADDYAYVIACGLKLPPGYNTRCTDMLFELPSDYPLSPLGVGDSHVYLPPALRLHGRRLEDLHEWRRPEFETPGFGKWAWFCYEYIDWSPTRDNLIKFVEMVRADLTRAKTRGLF
jgi:hypothetical protein